MKHGTGASYTKGCRCLSCTEAGMNYRRRGLPDGDPRHGTNGYTNYGCRCQICREANTVAQRRMFHARVARGLAPDDPRHGTSNAYGNYRCRCRPCTDAWTRDSYVTRARRQQRQEQS